MPFFFQFSKNGRKESEKPKKYAKSNNSVMNRICSRFMKMPNINMNLAGVAPFNWQMLMTHDIRDYNILAIRIFSQLDNNTSVMQMAHNASAMEDKVEILDYGIVAENIVHELAVNGITLEDAYPSIVKYLFTGANATKLAHKQMFWRVFGDYACKVIEQNIAACHKCENCSMRVPDWVQNHACTTIPKGFIKCIDCGKVVKRGSPTSCRCPDCAAEHRRIYLSAHNEKKKQQRRQRRKESA